MAAYDELQELRARALASSAPGVNDPIEEPNSVRLDFIHKYVDLFLVDNPYATVSEIVSDLEQYSFQLSQTEVDEIAAQVEMFIQNNLQSSEPSIADSSSSRHSSSATIESAADPVSLFSGEFTYQTTDFSIDGAGIHFGFIRTYRNQARFKGPLGANWSHSGHIFIRESPQALYRSTATTREQQYFRHPRFGQSASGDFDYWIPPDGVHAVAFVQGDSYAIRDASGSRQIFERLVGQPSIHVLKRIEDRFGNYIHFERDGISLRRVHVNGASRYIDFETDEYGRICAITDFTGRRWTYQYDSFGRFYSGAFPGSRAPSMWRVRRI